MHTHGDWQAVEGVLSKDMATVGEHLQTWKLKLNTEKTVSTVFHLNSKDVKRELKVNYNNETLPFCFEPKYLGVTLDRSLTYRRLIESLRKMLTSHVALLRRLAGSSWGAEATTLRDVTLALVHSTAGYCAPVWCCSANTRLIDCTINDALRIVTGCLRPTPGDNLPILVDIQPTGIQPAELRCIRATLSPARWAMEPGHLHSTLTCPPGTNARRLKSNTPICTRRTTHLFIWQQHQECGALGRSPMECGVVGQHYETPYFHLRHRHPPSWNGPSKNSVGPA